MCTGHCALCWHSSSVSSSRQPCGIGPVSCSHATGDTDAARLKLVPKLHMRRRARPWVWIPAVLPWDPHSRVQGGRFWVFLETLGPFAWPPSSQVPGGNLISEACRGQSSVSGSFFPLVLPLLFWGRCHLELPQASALSTLLPPCVSFPLSLISPPPQRYGSGSSPGTRSGHLPSDARQRNLPVPQAFRFHSVNRTHTPKPFCLLRRSWASSTQQHSNGTTRAQDAGLQVDGGAGDLY